MADALVARVLAPHIAATTGGVAEVPLTLHVVVPDTVLFDDPDAHSRGWRTG